MKLKQEKNMKYLIIAVAFFLSACATTGGFNNQLYVQYATLKLIEQSSAVDSEIVVEAVSKARQLVNENYEIELFGIAEQLGVAKLDAADRLLVGAIINSIELNLPDALPDDRKIRINQFLDWVEQAALVAN